MPWDCAEDDALSDEALADEASADCEDCDSFAADDEALSADDDELAPDDEAALVPHPASAKHAAIQIATIAIVLFMDKPPRFGVVAILRDLNRGPKTRKNDPPLDSA